MRKKFSDIFPVKKPIIGMIHLVGKDYYEKIDCALEEISIYEEEGMSGAIIENYHGHADSVLDVLEHLEGRENKLVIGINLLGYLKDSFKTASKFDIPFIQIDSIHPIDIPLKRYQKARGIYPEVSVFGGINFKYKTQEKGDGLERELKRAMKGCEAIVTTGEGTGIETPTNELDNFRKIIGDYPLIIGAGLNKDNVYEQLSIADGAIVGSFFKYGDTRKKVKKEKVRELIEEVNRL